MLNPALHNANHWARGLRDSYDKCLHCALDTVLLNPYPANVENMVSP